MQKMVDNTFLLVFICPVDALTHVIHMSPQLQDSTITITAVGNKMGTNLFLIYPKGANNSRVDYYSLINKPPLNIMWIIFYLNI